MSAPPSAIPLPTLLQHNRTVDPYIPARRLARVSGWYAHRTNARPFAGMIGRSGGSQASAPAAGQPPIQSITIEGYTQEEEGAGFSPFIAYTIVIKLPVQTLRTRRRFSEFVALAASLRSLAPPKGAGRPPPRDLPPKKAVQQTWSLLSRRNDGGETIRRTAEERLPELRDWLKHIVDADDPVWKSAGVFHEFLGVPEGTRFAASSPSEVRQRLAAGAGFRNEASTASENPAASRTAALLRRPVHSANEPARETDRTRPLDDRQVFESQQTQMDDQDRQLDRLAGILRRQKEMGIAINSELIEQSELLGALDAEVGATQAKLGKGEELMKKLNG